MQCARLGAEVVDELTLAGQEGRVFHALHGAKTEQRAVDTQDSLQPMRLRHLVGSVEGLRGDCHPHRSHRLPIRLIFSRDAMGRRRVPRRRGSKDARWNTGVISEKA